MIFCEHSDLMPRKHHTNTRRQFTCLLAMLCFLLIQVPQKGWAYESSTMKCLEAWQYRESQQDKFHKVFKAGVKAAQNQLSARERETIRSYIRLDERLRFRCGTFSPPPVPNPFRKK